MLNDTPLVFRHSNAMDFDELLLFPGFVFLALVVLFFSAEPAVQAGFSKQPLQNILVENHLNQGSVRAASLNNCRVSSVIILRGAYSGSHANWVNRFRHSTNCTSEVHRALCSD